MEYIADSYYILTFLIITSFCAGFIDSIAGGGGFILVPALMLAGLSPTMAVATNKLPAVFGTATAAYNFIRSKTVIWPIALIGLVCAFLGGMVGSNLNLGLSQDTLNKIVLFILPIAAIVTFIPKKNLKQNVTDFTKKELYIAAPFITFVLGIYDGFFGPGMGTFLIIAFYSILGMNMVNASAVAKIVNFASGAGALVMFLKAGQVIIAIGIPLLIANVLGSYIGSKMAIKNGQAFVKKILIIVFIVMFVSLIIKIVQG